MMGMRNKKENGKREKNVKDKENWKRENKGKQEREQWIISRK